MLDDRWPGVRPAPLVGRPPRSGFVFGLLMAGMVGGCTVGPDFSAPAAPSEKSYTAQPVRMRVSAGAGMDQRRVDMGGRVRMDWWTLLESQDLDQTVQLALSNNKTLDIAKANVAKATEELKAARGALYPQVDASAQFWQQKYGAT